MDKGKVMEHDENRRRMSKTLGLALGEYYRIRNHRDELLGIIRKRKHVARRQEAAIQKLAAERNELRQKVEQYESAPFGTYISAPRYDGNGPWIAYRDVVTFESGTASFEGIVDELTYHRHSGWRAKVYVGDGIVCNVPTCKLTLKNDAKATVTSRLAKEANLLMGKSVLPEVGA